MPKNNNKKSNEQHEFDSVLRSSGILFPETEEEVKSFYEIYGTTKVDLPERLQTADFLFEEKKPEAKIIAFFPFEEETVPVSQLAYAARDGQEDLPEFVAQKMKKLKEERKDQKNKTRKKK